MDSQTKPKFRRIFWIVLDGVGAGALPDAEKFGDLNSDTLGNLSKAFSKKIGRDLKLPNLQAMGLGNLTSIQGVPALQSGQGRGFFGKAQEASTGKDTTSGHWEMTGLVVTKPFAVFPNGFPQEVVDRWVQENQLSGILWNKPASGTEIIDKLGEEHVKTLKPILYTSADSVWQIAAHEEAFGLERLYSISKSARKICDELQIGRVIARPFIGDPKKGIPFKRTYNRKDYSQIPHQKTVLDRLNDLGVATLGIGKISNIFAGRGIQNNLDTQGNTDGLKVLAETIRSDADGLIYCNLIDFDMLYGHRRDVEGFGLALEEFDRAWPTLEKNLKPTDLVMITADHGNDPTYRGTDHTREYVPILGFSPSLKKEAIPLGIRPTFGDMGATVYEALSSKTLTKDLAGKSFLQKL